jgi:hypothetical protein
VLGASLAGISALAAAWKTAMGSAYQRSRRLRNGLESWRLVQYADLCRARHKSAYADSRIMPRRAGSALFKGIAVTGVSLFDRSYTNLFNPVGGSGLQP